MPLVASLLVSFTVLCVVYRWAVSVFPLLQRRRRAVAAAMSTLWLEQIAAGWIAIHWRGGIADSVHTAGSVVLIAMGIAAGPILLLQAVSWTIARLPPNAPSPVSHAASSTAMTRRQMVEGAGGFAVMGSSSAVLGWGAIHGRHMYEVCEVPLRIPGLPRALDGYTIAQISDLHAGVHLEPHDLDTGLALVQSAKADLIVVTGDMVDLDPKFAPAVARKLADLRARDGVTAILGNHDHYAGGDAVARVLRAAGVEVLVNQGRLLRKGDGGGFALLGVDDRWSAHYGGPGARLDLALAMVPADAPRILLSHQPATVDGWAGRVALQLSGHTHGGQINPGFRPAGFFFRYLAGAYSVSGTTLYVNRGFGTVGPPSRVGSPPEITRIVLVAA